MTWIQDVIPRLGEAEILAKNPAPQGSDPGMEGYEPEPKIYVLTPAEVQKQFADYFDAYWRRKKLQ